MSIIQALYSYSLKPNQMQYTGFLTSLSINQYDLLFLNDQKLSYKLLKLF